MDENGETKFFLGGGDVGVQVALFIPWNLQLVIIIQVVLFIHWNLQLVDFRE
jgi:hypothetical protein